MNHLYLQLGRAIAGQCPPGFSRAKLEAALDEAPAELKISCALADGSEVAPDLDEAAREDIRAALESIRAEMAKEDGRSWRSCTVTLIVGGGFEMDVAY